MFSVCRHTHNKYTPRGKPLVLSIESWHEFHTTGYHYTDHCLRMGHAKLAHKRHNVQKETNGLNYLSKDTGHKSSLDGFFRNDYCLSPCLGE